MDGHVPYDGILSHLGHKIVVAYYGEMPEPMNVAIECEDCHEVIVNCDHEEHRREEGDPITRPKHYVQGKVEVLDAIMLLGLDPCEANVLKYVARHTMKDGREDLMKAKEYITLMLENYDTWYMETPDE